MINTSDKLVFLTQGQELKNGINEAIRITRQHLFDTFSEGKVITAENITSSSKRVPRTYVLAFCKFFNGKDIFIQDPALSAENFLNQCNSLTEESRQQRNLDQLFFDGIIPNFEIDRTSIPAVLSHELKRGVLVMLFVLWKNRHILLTTNFVMPTTKLSKHSSPIMLCKPFYTEVIAFFQSFRQKAIPGTSKLKPAEGLTYSIQNTIQSYAWRVVVATDWHRIEDVKCEDCVKFLDHLQLVSHEHDKRTPFPINHMVTLLQTRTDKLNFTVKDIAAARRSESSPLGTPVTDGEFRPTTIKQSVICEPISGTRIYANNPEWIDSQLSYIESCRKSDRKSLRNIQMALTTLNEYLFSVIPASKKENGEQDTSPPSPGDFGREYFTENSEYPTLREHIETNKNTNTTVYSKLREIDGYFSYLAKIDDISRKDKPFKNPIIREIDFPIVRSKKGTTKKTVSQLFTPALMSYVYAMESLFEYVFNKLRFNDEKMRLLFLNYGPNANTMISTEELGYVPFISFRGRHIPITEVKLDIFGAQEVLLDHFYYLRVPAWSHLIQMIVCLETGIRTLHIEWLDIRTYDQEIDRSTALGELVNLYIPTDKVRTDPWIAKVSKRVIGLLDKQRKILSDVNQPWGGNPIWYDKHENSPFGKIVPAFPSIACTSQGLPSRVSYEKLFKRMFYSFQEFANKQELYSKKIDWVNFDPTGEEKYKSKITPHSCRATLISNAIHYLPPEFIGAYITGHTTVNSVSHYVVLDEPYMDELAAFQANSVRGMESFSLLKNNGSAIRADHPKSALYQAIAKDPLKTMSDFSGISFESENKDGEIVSGLSVLKSAHVSQLAHHSTHICPCNNVCPPDVVTQIGARNCGQCWLAIKTVDHLPRIDSHIRKLYAELQESLDYIDEIIANNASKTVIEEKEREALSKSAELTAWIVSLNILEEQRKNVAMRDRFLVGKPEIVERHIVRMATEDNPMTNLLLRVQDAINYPEYLTPQLKASMTKARNMLLVKTGQFERLLSEPKGYAQADEFRGLIRGLVETTNMSLEEIQTLMMSEVPQIKNRIPLLEIA